jgi:hypothetical protein
MKQKPATIVDGARSDSKRIQLDGNAQRLMPATHSLHSVACVKRWTRRRQVEVSFARALRRPNCSQKADSLGNVCFGQ